jgi:hypothetical protein
LLLTLVVGILAGVYVGFWSPTGWALDSNYGLMLVAFAALLSTSTLGAIFGRPNLRRFFMGYAALNWLLLVMMLLSWFITDHGHVLIVGPAVGVVCGILANWLLLPPKCK